MTTTNLISLFPSTTTTPNSAVTHCEVREKTNKMQQLDVYYQYFLNMFRAPLCPSSGEQDVCYCTLCAALVLLYVVGSGCGALRCTERSLRTTFPIKILS